MAGDGWAEKAREAALDLSYKVEDISPRIQLLVDIRKVINAEIEDNAVAEKIFSGRLARELNEMEESPWAGYSKGNGIAPHTVAKMVKEFGIKPVEIRDGMKTGRGYYFRWFDDVFERYIPTPENSETVKRPDTDSAYAPTETSFTPSETNNTNETELTPSVSSVSDVSGLKTKGGLGWN